MGKVLLGWELGAGLGHANRLRLIADALASHGHQPVLAIKNLADTSAILGGASYPVLQAPLFHPRPWRGATPFTAHTYADILAIRGWSSPEDLAALVRAWQSLIDAVRPELVVCDYSPTLALAAFRGVPTLWVGNGFALPPADLDRFPPLAPYAAPVVSQEQILEVVCQVQRRRGRSAPATLPRLFDAEARCLTVFREIDPYRSLRNEPYLGPELRLPGPTPPPRSPRFFAYLNGDAPYVDALLEVLAATGVPVQAYVRGGDAARRAKFASTRLELRERPPALAEVLPDFSAVLHHAGAGTCQEALAAGRPQLLLPEHLEQVLTADALAELGVGQSLTGTIGRDQLVSMIQEFAANQAIADRALDLAQVLAQRTPQAALPIVMDRCLTLLRSVAI